MRRTSGSEGGSGKRTGGNTDTAPRADPTWFANDPMAELILHVNREVMHHGGEIGVLRDLYARSLG